jgi:pyridoxamine 5'-phosphate oxidase
MIARIESLHLVETACWQELARAARESEHAWRVMALATFDGECAQARSVVLRDVRPDERTLLFYTDDRSPKVAQLKAHPAGTLLAWSQTMSWQLRLRVNLQFVNDGLEVSSRWARMKLSPAAQDYLSPLAPGAPLERTGTERATREHFAIVTARVEGMDWLELHADGHRRAIFDDSGARWVQP